MSQAIIPADHDQRFKALIREFFADFLKLFFADWAKRFDLSQIEWLDGELLPDPPAGSRHQLDLVAKLRATEPIEPDTMDWLAIVQIEVESTDRTTRITPRLPNYYLHLSDRYGLPVLPVVLYMSVALDGLGTAVITRRFWELEVLRMQYLYVGLPGLNAEEYVGGENWLGVALSALMKMPAERASEVGLQALQRLTQAELTEQQHYLLSECVEAYLPVDRDELNRLREQVILGNKEQSMALHRNKTSYDIGREEGIEKGRNLGMEEGRDLGRRIGMLELLEAQLQSRFGELSESGLAQLRGLTDAQLRDLAIKVATATSLAELGLLGSSN